MLLDALLDHRDWSGLGAVARDGEEEEEEESAFEAEADDDVVHREGSSELGRDTASASALQAAADQHDESVADDEVNFDSTQHLDSGSEAGSADSQYEIAASPPKAPVADALDRAAPGEAVSVSGSQGCEAVSAGASSKGLDLAPSAGSGSHAVNTDAVRDDSDRQANRQAKKDRIAAFVKDSQACTKASYPVAVSLPQLSEGAMGQLVDNFFYCNFEIDSFRKHVAFGISHHFYHQKLSFLCSYVGGDVPVDQVPTLTEQDLAEIRQLKSVEKWLEDGSPGAVQLADASVGARRGYKKRFMENDDVAREQAQKWLLDLRQHYSRLPAVLRLLHHAFVECTLIKKTRLADTIRYVQQYLVSAEEQESGDLRNKLKEELLGLPTSRLLKLVTQWRDTLRAHSSWVSRQGLQSLGKGDEGEHASPILEPDPILAIWMHRLVDIEGDLKREAAGREPPAPIFSAGSRSCTECEFENGCAKCNTAHFPTASEGLHTEAAVSAASATATIAPTAATAGPAAPTAGLNPAMRRKMVLTKAGPKPMESECAEKIRRAVVQIATEWIDLHLDVDRCRPAANDQCIMPATDSVSTNMVAARRRPLAEVVVWNGRSALRKFRHTKVQPRDAIVQGKSSQQSRFGTQAQAWLVRLCLTVLPPSVVDRSNLAAKTYGHHSP